MLKKYMLIVVVLFAIFGCASVPKEVVELSYTIGNDLENIQSSYKSLVLIYFEGLRKQAADFINNEWRPKFISNYVESSNLTERLSNQNPEIVLFTLENWTDIALEKIEAKKKVLVGPIDEQEQELLLSIDNAFSNVIRSNAIITAHLNSIREVKELQDETLNDLGLLNLRDTVNEGLLKASEKTDEAIMRIKIAEGMIKKVEEIKKSIEDK
jgi:hypothetical protein